MSRAPDPPEELQEEPYLWDRSGPKDEGIEHLEQVLGSLRHDAPLVWKEPAGPAKLATVRRLPRRALAAGGVVATLAAAAALFLVVRGRTPDELETPLLSRGWEAPSIGTSPIGPAEPAPSGMACAPSVGPDGFTFEALAGTPTCGGAPAAQRGQLPKGTWLETDAASRVKLDIANIGHVEVDPSSRLRVVETRPDQHRLELARGGLRAKIDAPPRLFFVDTKAATAVDLGCEYELQVDDRGAGRLKVMLGFVELEMPKSIAGHASRRPALVPRHAECLIDPERGPGTPVWTRTPADVRDALAKFDRTGDEEALGFVLSHMTSRDSLTLYHLLERVGKEARARIYDQLVAIVPWPGISKSATVALEPAALKAWRDLLEPRWFPTPKK